jgi:CSLREA domain-containing protein
MYCFNFTRLAAMKKNYFIRTLRSIWCLPLIICILAVIALPPLHAYARPEGKIITVNTTTDELNELNPNGNCSLREAIRAANLDTAVDGCPAGNGADEIVLPQGNYLLSIEGVDENEARTGDLDITADVRITGRGPDGTVIDGNSIDRVFHIIGPAVHADFYSLVIQNGYSSGTEDLDGGGGIYNSGVLTLAGCILRNNQTPRIGGGVDNTGTLIVFHSTFHNNSALDGGGIFNGGTANLNSVTFYDNNGELVAGGFDNWLTASLTNVTFSGNTSPSGGGIFNDGDLALLNCTITGNTSGIANRSTARAKNTIIANSSDGSENNCTDSSVTSEGYNLDSGTSCSFTNVTDLSNTNPSLGSLSDNGGPTWTHILLSDSPAIDKGSNLECPHLDQRGALRPADGDGNSTAICDIGSVEFNGIFPAFIYLPIIQR